MATFLLILSTLTVTFAADVDVQYFFGSRWPGYVLFSYLYNGVLPMVLLTFSIFLQMQSFWKWWLPQSLCWFQYNNIFRTPPCSTYRWRSLHWRIQLQLGTRHRLCIQSNQYCWTSTIFRLHGWERRHSQIRIEIVC